MLINKWPYVRWRPSIAKIIIFRNKRALRQVYECVKNNFRLKCFSFNQIYYIFICCIELSFQLSVPNFNHIIVNHIINYAVFLVFFQYSRLNPRNLYVFQEYKSLAYNFLFLASEFSSFSKHFLDFWISKTNSPIPNIHLRRIR